MKVSLEWLGEWIDLPTLEEIDERLTVGGLEIEEVLRTGPDLSAFRVGHVVAREQHPNADRLSLCSVDVGEGEPLDIVCGAPNVAAGQKVVVALHGTSLPDGSKIKRSKIRGVKSNGMICSARELELGDDHSGILELAPDALVGAPASDFLAGGDLILDIAITPNRGDWLSILGMAREVRAHFGHEIRYPAADVEESGDPAAGAVTIGIEDSEGCPCYCGRVLRGVSVGPSPEWLVKRLEAAGIRSINNVVDVTNYVMMEWGQPLHAFDLSTLAGGEIRVRSARDEETLTTLDGEERKLETGDLVIADRDRAIAIAGVMGGAETEVQGSTRDILIEAALFHPSRVRKTARRLGLSTDASYRFERGVDREGPPRAASRAARLIQELAGGTVAPGIVRAEGSGAKPPEPVRVTASRVNRVLGTELSAPQMADLLARLDIETSLSGEELLCAAPSYRNDIAIPEDIVEEVARVHGYGEIPSTLPRVAAAGVSAPPLRPVIEGLRDGLAGAGLVELMTFSVSRPDDLAGLRLEEGDRRKDRVPLANPIRAEEPFLRSSLLPSVLRAVQQNLSRQLPGVGVFEVGRVFVKTEPGELPDESVEAVVAVAGEAESGLWARGAPPFFHLKGCVERALTVLGVRTHFRAGSTEPFLHPGAAACFLAGKKQVAALGELHPETASHFGIEVPIAVAVLDLDGLLASPRPKAKFREVSRFPSARRDFAVLFDSDIAGGTVLEAIRKAAGKLLSGAEIFDRYEGKGVPEGKVSLAFRLVFQNVDRTLTDDEVNQASDRVVQVLRERFKGELR